MLNFIKCKARHYGIFSSLLLPPATQKASPHNILRHPQPTASLPFKDQVSHPFKPTAKIKGSEV
jgi:hypothetical protein